MQFKAKVVDEERRRELSLLMLSPSTTGRWRSHMTARKAY
jgi:hypothetical protein